MPSAVLRDAAVDVVARMTRQRWFCSLCGAMTTRPPDDGRYARCVAHSNLPREADLTPPDPLTTIPPMAAELDLCRCGASGYELCRRPVGLHCYRDAVREREDVQATRGSGA